MLRKKLNMTQHTCIKTASVHAEKQKTCKMGMKSSKISKQDKLGVKMNQSSHTQENPVRSTYRP